MTNPVGSDSLLPLYVYDDDKRQAEGSELAADRLAGGLLKAAGVRRDDLAAILRAAVRYTPNGYALRLPTEDRIDAVWQGFDDDKVFV